MGLLSKEELELIKSVASQQSQTMLSSEEATVIKDVASNESVDDFSNSDSEFDEDEFFDDDFKEELVQDTNNDNKTNWIQNTDDFKEELVQDTNNDNKTNWIQNTDDLKIIVSDLYEKYNVNYVVPSLNKESFINNFFSANNMLSKENVEEIFINYIDKIKNSPNMLNNSDTRTSLQESMIDELVNQNNELKRKLEELFNCSTSEIKDSINEGYSSDESIFNSELPFERVISEPQTSEFMGTPFKYQKYEAPLDFGEKFERGLSNEDTAINFVNLCNKIYQDILLKFGGADRITDIAVISNILIINGVSYEPFFPECYSESLPFDLRNNVLDGQFAWLFDFKHLRHMKNLTNLKFDTLDFVYTKVRKDMGIVFDFEPSIFFKYCKRLCNLQIGTYCFTQNTKYENKEIFHKQRRSEELYNWCTDNCWGATKSGWGSVIDCFKDPDRSFLGKLWGISWRTGLSSAGTLTTLGLKLGNVATKGGKGLINFMNIVKENK